jgi:hypothetical protein
MTISRNRKAIVALSIICMSILVPWFWPSNDDRLREFVERDDVFAVVTSIQSGKVPIASLNKVAPAMRSVKMLELLRENGCNLNSQNAAGNTALHLAAYRCDIELTLALVADGANVNARNKWGDTPLHMAVMCFPHDSAEDNGLLSSDLSGYKKLSRVEPVVGILMDAGASNRVYGDLNMTPDNHVSQWCPEPYKARLLSLLKVSTINLGRSK